MHLKLFPTATLVAVFLMSAIGVAAQVVTVSGKVTLKQADGTVVPVRGAIIDIYRTDIAQKFEAMTDSRGVYAQARLSVVGTYTIVVSAPGTRPDYHSGVRLMQQAVHDFPLVPGDGSRPTLDEIKAFEMKRSEIEKSNNKITQENEIVSRSFNAGNQALMSGNIDQAIEQYRQGLAIRPDEPAFLTNLSVAFRLRGTTRFNASLKMANSQAKQQLVDSAKKDWLEAARVSQRSLEILNKTTPSPDQQQIHAQNKVAAISTHALAMRLVATKVDQTQSTAAHDAYRTYIAIETDVVKKANLRGEMLQMLFDAGSLDLAVSEARKVLAIDANHLVGNRVLGLALFALAVKAHYQEAADHLQRYVDQAPESDPLKASVREALEYLRTAEGISPRARLPASGTSPRP